MKRFTIAVISILIVIAFAVTAAFAGDAKAPTKNPIVVIKTSMGTMKAEIFADKAPITATNFMKYVDDKFYDGTIFHRVIPGFMVQGGGFDGKMNEKKKTRDPIKNEATNGLKNTPGTLAMARLPMPDSATAQFFINTVVNKSLDHQNTTAEGMGYAVFGKITEGMDVVNKISGVKTHMNPDGMGDVPDTNVVIESITRAK